MKLTTIGKVAVVALAVTSLSSCNIYKKFDMPTDTGQLQSYVEARDAEADPATFGNLPWQQVFTDPMLQEYIYRALENNVDLANAKLNVDIAHANMNGARMAYLPSLALAPQGGASSVSNGKLTNWNYTIPLTASWEVDVFGKILNTKRGAEASYRQMQDYEQAVRSQIIGGVANCYYALVILKSELELSKQTAEIWRENVQTMRDYKLAGRTNEAAVVQSEANYLSIRASIKDLEIAIDQACSNMALLLHEPKRMFEVTESTVIDVPAIIRDGVPMRELARRPDIRAAEEALAAAYYTTNSARAAFYPNITISATYGFTNSLGSYIVNPGDWIASLAGSLVAPIFSRGQNIARLKASKAQQEQALNNFSQKLLSATCEVNGSMNAFRDYSEKALFIADQVANLEKSVYYTKELFASAGSTYLEVLTSQSSLLQAQMSQLECELAKAQAVINLYQALGGGR